MSYAEKLEILRAMTGENDLAALNAFLRLAARKIIITAFPFSENRPDFSPGEVPEEYEFLQLEMAQYMLNKRGAEGEISHSENGISRSYENGDIPDSMLRQITPACAVV